MAQVCDCCYLTSAYITPWCKKMPVSCRLKWQLYIAENKIPESYDYRRNVIRQCFLCPFFYLSNSPSSY